MKKLSVLLLIMVMSFSFSSYASTSEEGIIEKADMQIKDPETFILPTIYFYDREVLSHSTSGTHMEHEKYLTSYWAYASCYHYGETEEIEIGWFGGFSAGTKSFLAAELGLNLSHTQAYSIVTDIPADPTRLSKLSLYGEYEDGDATVEVTKWHFFLFFKIVDDEWTESGAYDEPVDQYLLVDYQ